MPSSSSVTSESKAKRRRNLGDALVIGAIAIFILFACFGRTVVMGKGISNLPVLASEDNFFNNQIRFSVPRPRFDPSLYYFHIPFQLYAAGEMEHLRLPLWNPCFGCGFPTFAELQYCTFSPFRGLFGASNKYFYNLGIVIKVLIAALGTFFLARLLSMSTGASAFAAIAYGLCPFVMRELELPNEVEYIPAVACAFLFLAGKSTLKDRLLLAITAALALASMHPEFFFISVLFAVSLLAIARCFRGGTSDQSEVQLPPFKSWFFNLLSAGLICLCLAAPLLFPFLELASCADSYKFHSTFIQKPPLNTLLVGLITPLCKGGSPFVGIVALLLAIFASISAGRRLLPLTLTVLALILWTSAPGPLAQVAAMKPFSFIPPRYFLAPLLLYLTLLSAQAVDIIQSLVSLKQWKKLIPLALLAVILAAIPFFLVQSAGTWGGFDGTLPEPSIVQAEVLKGPLALAMVFISIFLFQLNIVKPPPVAVLPYLLLLANLLSLGGSARLSLPPTLSFSFTSCKALETIQASGERMTAVGQSFFKPNISMVYDVRDLRLTGPIMPKWMASFQRLLYQKGRSTGFLVSPLLDAASVKYIISRWPVLSSASISDNHSLFTSIAPLSQEPHPVMDGLILLGADHCLSAQGELFIRLTWQTLKPVASMFASQLDIVDQDGRRLRQGQRSIIQMAKVGDNSVQYLSVKVPDAQPPSKGGDLYAVLHLTGVLNEAYLPIAAPGLTIRDHAIELLNLSKTSRTAKIDPELKENRLEYVGEDANQILLYRNNQALPQAYLTDSILIANSLEDACQKFASQGFNPHQKTILETRKETDLPAAHGTFQIPQAVTRENASKVIVKATAPSECYLILTDTFYNGWQAFLDDKPVATYRANVCFRAVKLPAGRHTVRFEFIPFSFFAGLSLATVSIMLLSLLAWFNCRKSRKSKNE